MGKRLFVGNLPFSATDESLMQMFQQAGQVESARIITDRDTGRNKGFGFVEMSTEQQAGQRPSEPRGARRFFEINLRYIDNGVIRIDELFEMRPSECAISVMLIIQTTLIMSRS
jgi:hypothetical protein